jgi:predicted Zn-dependent protease
MRYVLAALAVIIAFAAAAQESLVGGLPPFLRPYFADALGGVGKGMVLRVQDKKDNISTYAYERPDQSAGLTFQDFACERDRCQVLYDNAVRYFDKLATENSGRFLKATPTEFAAEWNASPKQNKVFAAKLPNSVLFTTYSAGPDAASDTAGFLAKLGIAVNHQRYDEAVRMDQVQAGLWSSQIHAFASELLRGGKRDEAVAVLKNVVASAPFDYQAHLEIAENTTDSAAARDSANVVYENAEDPTLVARAERYLGPKKQDALPATTKDDGSLQVVLIILPSCDPRIASEAALLYEKTTGIPVRLSRLAEDADIKLGAPDRIPDQRRIQQAMIQKMGPTVDFSGWDLTRYGSELLKTVELGSALARFSTEDFVAKLQDRPGQYDAGRYLERLTSILVRYRSQNSRAIYVGLTATDIFLGDTNYVFSANVGKGDNSTSLVSYSRMTARMTGERYESRKRLIERLAKQLVPPTLATLGIPRPTDPTDPYSYADSVERVDQKTLTLSGPTKAALDKLR